MTVNLGVSTKIPIPPLSKYVFFFKSLFFFHLGIITHTNSCRLEHDPNLFSSSSQIFTLECYFLAACQKPSCSKCFTHLRVQLVELMRWRALQDSSALVITGLRKHIHHLPHRLAFQVKTFTLCKMSDKWWAICKCVSTDGSTSSARGEKLSSALSYRRNLILVTQFMSSAKTIMEDKVT